MLLTENISPTSLEELTNFMQSLSGFAPGFGKRLKIERRRLKKTQAEFGRAGAVMRMTQISYEKETTAPSMAYLSLIAAIGVDLMFLFFAIRLNTI